MTDIAGLALADTYRDGVKDGKFVAFIAAYSEWLKGRPDLSVAANLHFHNWLVAKIRRAQ